MFLEIIQNESGNVHQGILTRLPLSPGRTHTRGKVELRKEQIAQLCAGKKALKGFNDLGTTHPQIANQAYEWDPESLTAGSNKKKDWICQLGHIWKAAINNRTSQNLGCPICSNQQVLAGFNDLLTTNPALALEAHLWDPSTVTQGANVKRKWKCPRVILGMP